MAVVQYNNGYIDNIKPKALVFEDSELIDFFKGYRRVRSIRLLEVPNSWCLWGEEPIDTNFSSDDEFNYLATKVVGDMVYSPLMIIHDTELAPEWNITDKIIIRQYKEFKKDLLIFLDTVAEDILDEAEESPENMHPRGFHDVIITPVLLPVGTTQDRKIIIEFDPSTQNDKFYNIENFSGFATRSFEYIHKYFDKNLGVKGNSLVIYADSKVIIIVRDDCVDTYIDYLLKNYEKRENYRGCNHILAFQRKWHDYIKGMKIPMTTKWEDYLNQENKK